MFNVSVQISLGQLFQSVRIVFFSICKVHVIKLLFLEDALRL